MATLSDDVLERLRRKYNDDMSTLNTERQNEEGNVELSLQERLSQIPGQVDQQDYYTETLDMLPSGAALRVLAERKQNAATAQETQARRDAIQQLRSSRQLAAQGMSNLRQQLARDESFYGKPWEAVANEAPQLDGLRKDIIVDPNTMSFRQTKRANLDEDGVRDQEIADYYGVSPEIVAAKRRDTYIAAGKAAKAQEDAVWKQTRRAHTLNQMDAWYKDRSKKEQEDLLKAEDEQRGKQVKELNLRTARAKQMDPVTRAQILSSTDPTSFDEETRKVATLSQTLEDLAKDDTSFDKLEKYTEHIHNTLINAQIRNNTNLMRPPLEGVDFGATRTQATQLAHDQWPQRQTMRNEYEKERAKALGAVSTIDAALGTSATVIPTPSVPRGVAQGGIAQGGVRQDVMSQGGVRQGQKLNDLTSEQPTQDEPSVQRESLIPEGTVWEQIVKPQATRTVTRQGRGAAPVTKKESVRRPSTFEQALEGLGMWFTDKKPSGGRGGTVSTLPITSKEGPVMPTALEERRAVMAVRPRKEEAELWAKGGSPAKRAVSALSELFSAYKAKAEANDRKARADHWAGVDTYGRIAKALEGTPLGAYLKLKEDKPLTRDQLDLIDKIARKLESRRASQE
jgi:hypothetical protein